MEKIIAPTARREAIADRATENREFAAVDSKGRRFGARANLYSVAYGPVEQAELWNYGDNVAQHAAEAAKAGTTWFGFRPHALRAGELYGASHGSQEFATAAERDAAVAKYFAQAEKRALANKARAK